MTDEQMMIVGQPPEARQLVIAGPGTGKTYTLIARLVHLVTEHGLQPGADIAVLTFSRAAVREIRDRLSAAGGDAAYVRAVTFDSFATRLLAEYQNGDLAGLGGYDGRIKAATRLIKHDPGARERIGGFAHIFIDEVQDLVGVRADFVEAILQLAKGGYTLLGDPAQGIYDFQLEAISRQTNAGGTLAQLRAAITGPLTVTTLTVNHRAETPAARTALWAGDRLNAREPDYPRINDQLCAAVGKLSSLGQLEDACPRLMRLKCSTAILCRTNGQALMISRTLYNAGVPHLLQRRATDRVLPAWIARVLSGYSVAKIGRRTFFERAGSILAPEQQPRAWSALERTEGGGGPALDLTRLSALIKAGQVPDELVEQSRSHLVVSTIHRAKGLEFDRVILAMAEGDFEPDEFANLADETRLLYVALTRPKRELQHLQLPRFKGVQVHKRTDRWICRYEPWRIRAMEVTGDDTDAEDPPGAAAIDVDPNETQTYLVSTVRPGDAVELTRCRVSAENEPASVYAIMHGGRPIGITSANFAQDLFRVLKINPGWNVNWPARISELRIDAVETVAGSIVSGRQHGLGAAGLWLRPRAAGLGVFHFDPVAAK